MRKSVVAVVSVLFLSGALNAQPMKWKIVAPRVLQPTNGGAPPAEFGAIAAKQNTILAGWSNLTLSTDGGATWTALSSVASSNNVITDLAVWDAHTFAFMSIGAGAYLTNDGGNSWQHIDNHGDGISITFDGAPTRLAMTHLSNTGYVYNSGVLTPFTLQLQFGSTIRTAADGTLRILGGNPSQGWLFSSSNHGVTWSQSQPFPQVDDFSFIPDQTDPNRFVIVNENWVYRLGGTANLLLTADNGATINTVYTQPLGDFAYISGNSTSGCHDYFVGTLVEGILRSSDKGLTWKSIWGPATAIDSHSIAAADDSLIFAIDTLGNIWATDVAPRNFGPGLVTGGAFFQNLSISACDTFVTAPIYFTNNGCVKYGIYKIELTGKDTALYKIIGSLSSPFQYPDSIHIGFTPLAPGKTDAQLKITFLYGSVVTIDLGITVTPIQLAFSKKSLFANDTLRLCQTTNDTLKLFAPCTLDFTSAVITGADSASFQLKTKKSGTLPADSVVRITCSPRHTGALAATLHLVLHDGRTFDIPLSAFIEITPVSISPAALFTNDTITLCASDTSILHLAADCPLDILSFSFRGSDSLSFILSGKNSASLPKDSLITIICIPQHEGNLSASLHLIIRDGRTFDVPLSLFVSSCALAVYPSKLFSGDTILICESDSAIIHLSSQSGLDITSITIGGADSASFNLHGKTSAVLPKDSIIRVFCNPLHEGNLSSIIHLVSSDGRTWDLPINLTIAPTPLAFQPAALFTGDTIFSCFNDSAEIHLSAPCPLDLSSLAILGTDASSFSIAGKNSATLPGDSNVRIICTPQHSGNLAGSIHIVTVDRRSWDIPMSLFVTDPPLSVHPSVLFVHDTFSLCSISRDSVLLGSLCPQNISSISVTGIDDSSFNILGIPPFQLPKDSFIVVECHAQHEGLLNATLHIVSVSGNVFDIPLSPVISGKTKLAFGNISDGYTDVVGGDVTIPITFHTGGSNVNAGFSIHYDTTSLNYIGVFDSLNTDHTSGHPDNHSARIAFNSRDTILFAKFSFFPVDSNCVHITIDSLTAEAVNCLSVFSHSLEASICSPAECARGDLARFLKYGSMPQITVVPNPSSGAITIASSLQLGKVRISLTDNVGREIFYSYKDLSPVMPAKINIDELPSGIYFLRVAGINSAKPLLLQK